MDGKRRNKKRKCNDKKEEELSLKVQEIKHEYTIEVLNYHCLGEIISYLGPVDRINLEKLCEKIKVASNIAWRRIKHLEISRAWYAKIIIKQCSMKAVENQNIIKQILVRCGNHLESLCLNVCRNPLMLSVVNKCHNLRKLVIECQKYDCKNFENPFKNMKNLKYLKIKLSKDNNVGLLKSLPKDIEEISIESNSHGDPLILPEDFEDFSNKWKALHSLSLKEFIIDESSNVFFDKNYPLTHLDLGNCSFANITQTEFLISSYKNLKYLNLMNNRSVRDRLIHIIANDFENLEYLNIKNCRSTSQEGLRELRKLKNIEELNFSDTSADDAALGQFKNLKILHCGWTFVSDTGVISVLDNSLDLENLDVRSTKITANTLSHASNLTNTREKKLVISASYGTVRKFDRRKEISSFLVVNDILFR